MDLKEEEILGDQVNSHWYYRAKAAALLQNMRGQTPREVLDVGAGSGFFSRMLLKETSAERATCVDIAYQQDRDEIWCRKPIAFRRSLSQCQADLVLAMDVIEHVADDQTLIRGYSDLVSPGTRFIFSVPAFNFLWSAHDVFLEHHRRYTLRSLSTAMRESGLVVDWGHYYYGSVFPLAAGIRLLERLKGATTAAPKSQLQQHSGMVNTALSAVLAAERPAMRFNKLFGLSVFAGGHKP
jgi:SAM-dependent methyltransferase